MTPSQLGRIVLSISRELIAPSNDVFRETRYPISRKFDILLSMEVGRA